MCVCAAVYIVLVPVCGGQVLATWRSVPAQLGHLDRRKARDPE